MRVIAGSARGRTLLAPPFEKIRPTGDKLKGAIFSMLEAEAFKRGFSAIIDQGDVERFALALAWPTALDLYAGSGSLGIEALSRGAIRCDFVEKNGEARSTIRRNLERTSLIERARLHAISVQQAASRLAGPFDLLLADPPYGDLEAGRALLDIASSLVTPSGILIWEHAAKLSAPPWLGPLRLLKSRRHGLSAISLYAASNGQRQQGADSEQPA